MSSKFVIRLAVWSFLMLYLLVDLVLIDGPLKRGVLRLQGAPEEEVAADRERGICARVFDKPILLSQVDYRVDELLWRSGRDRKNISKDERISLRLIALHEICDQYLLREKVMFNHKKYPVSEAEIDEALKRFASRFSNPEELASALKKFGFDGEKELRFRTAARLQQYKYLHDRIASAIEVSEEEAKAWYDSHQEEIKTPERIKAKHIFLSALNHDQQQADAILKPALEQILADPSRFTPLASKLSADPRSKSTAGELGWLTRARFPEDLAIPAFAAELNTPTIITTKLGWHLWIVTEKAAATLRPYPQMKEDIIASLETTKRQKAIATYRDNLRRQHGQHVRIDQDLLKRDWSQ